MKKHVTLAAAYAFGAVLCTAQFAPNNFSVSSPAVGKGGVLQAEFTCDGERASPPLAWSNPPAGTRFFAVTMHHIPGPGDKHVYLVVYNIPGNITSLPKNAKGIGSWGINTVNGQPEYTPPCSKGPGAKTYTLTVYALSSEARLENRVTMDALLAAIKDKTLATAAIDVTYSRTGTAAGPRLPQELERALSSLNLSDEQKQKVQGMVQQYGDKQRQLREELLQQLKTTLDPGQYAKVEAAMQQPTPPPGRRQ
jgi:phosphatidylethanolamine-binding protein (PEBP) family uncharacterized protein